MRGTLYINGLYAIINFKVNLFSYDNALLSAENFVHLDLSIYDDNRLMIEQLPLTQTFTK